MASQDCSDYPVAFKVFTAQTPSNLLTECFTGGVPSLSLLPFIERVVAEDVHIK